jgi:hypothetical protein
MATKTFCDICGKELLGLKDNFGPTYSTLEGVKGTYKMRLEIHSGRVVDACKYCIIDSFKSLDDRPHDAQS